QSYAIAKKTIQTVDTYGNVTQSVQYDWATLSVRTYNYTYLNSSPYTSRYIYNRLSSATVSDGSATVTLATNSYDQTGLAKVTGQREWDAGYSSVTTRGNLTTSITPTENRTLSYDVTGNVTGTTVNGVTTNVTTNSSTNYAAPYQAKQATTNGTATETFTWN